MKRGDIVLVRYPFTDFSSEKLRPAVVILPADEDDYLLAFITTNLSRKTAHDITLKASETRLHHDSLLRLRKLMSVHKSLVLGKIGTMPPHQLQDLDVQLKTMLQI